MSAENPKTGAGRLKVDFGAVPPLAMVYWAAAHDTGALKYDPFNWRDKPIPTRTYVAAMLRHLTLYAAGIDIDFELDEFGDLVLDDEGKPIGSGLPHLAMVMANAAILVDAASAGTLQDDRAKTPELGDVMRQIAELKKTWPTKAKSLAPAAAA
jgi:hypothetical protein